MEVTDTSVRSGEDFEKLILAYDYSTRRKSLYRVERCGWGTGNDRERRIPLSEADIYKEEIIMGYEEQATGTMGIPYYDSLLPEEQQEVTEAVKLLLRQTFVLERKYEKRSGALRITGSSGSATSIWNF